MASNSMRFLFFILSALQVHYSIYAVTAPFGFLVAAQSTDTSTLAASQDDLADFGQTIPILGQMARTDQDFKDGLALDLFSPRNRTLVVSKNTSPLPANFVSGSTGEPFVALSNYSWVIKVNDTARDLIAKVELPYDPGDVQRRGCDVANTYRANSSENKTRIIKLSSLDGEYILLGRQTVDTANVFVQYGFGTTRTVNLTGGKGIQEAEFVDGLRISIESEKDMRINVDLKNGVDAKAVPGGMRSLSMLLHPRSKSAAPFLPPNTYTLDSFAWAMNTSAPNQQPKRSSVRFPVNSALLSSSPNSTASIKNTKIIVAKRDLNASSSTPFMPLPQRSQKVSCRPDCSVTVKDLQQLDGNYIILAVGKEKAEGGTEAPREQIMKSPASSAGAILRGNENWAGVAVVLYTSVLVWLQSVY
ncbi:hypothetical protein BU23DRAFT_651902 [Bimuria novae-zelandiae CBS 107.79]|uniref:Uncharacterized protein n=1 Tax=Bimuria novae-zelandiae CBS 107.79 TaxID=1447943 RepID=A0A6A5V0H0_9PLEO|nr:hypothetical protein BU23DRAFT_651902 [Bimuria novae-zelandiae CBS 107.79]